MFWVWAMCATCKCDECSWEQQITITFCAWCFGKSALKQWFLHAEEYCSWWMKKLCHSLLTITVQKTLTKTKTSWGRKYLFGLQTTIHHSRQEPRSSNYNWDHEETLLTEPPDWSRSAHSELSSSLQPLIKKMTPTDLFTGQSDGGIISLKFTSF